jgi:hypothetical protein
LLHLITLPGYIMNGSASSYLKEIKRQHEAGSLSPEQIADFIVISLIEQALNSETSANRLDELETSMIEQFRELSSKIDKAVEHQTDHPSLIYLLRFKTKQTIAAIIFAFIIFSSWFVSGVRQPILEFLGLPIF